MLDKVVAETIQEKKGLSSEAVAGLLNGKKGKPLGTLAVEKGLPTEEELLTSPNQKLRVPSVKDLEGEGLGSSLSKCLEIIEKTMVHHPPVRTPLIKVNSSTY
jgi:hypothetical protein